MNLKKYRKIVAEYTSSFSELETRRKKPKVVTQKTIEKIIINKKEYILNQTRNFSIWEEKIIKTIENSGFKTERKFFKFPLKIEGKMFLYIPDLLIRDLFVNRKKVIVEAHEKITESDIKKYRKFQSLHGAAYHLVMIVSSRDLREWNIYDKKEGIFHEIWTSKDVDVMISKLQRKQKECKKIDSAFGTHVCPSCGKSATGREETKTEFGFRKKRNGQLYTQSLCYDCRNKHAKRTRKRVRN